MSEDSYLVAPPASMKRIPKACSACRVSKVKCDGRRPCTRCQKIKKQCVFFEIPRDPVAERLESVESEVRRLQGQLDEMREMLLQPQQPDAHAFNGAGQSTGPGAESQTSRCGESFSTISPAVTAMTENATGTFLGQSSVPLQQHVPALQEMRPAKRRRSEFEIREEPISDFIRQGLITTAYARDCFTTFFQGCDRYIPVFDPKHDTFESVRYRSSMLLNAICTIGSRVESRSSQLSELLQAELKKWINVVIQNEALNCLESIQALLVIACYSAERSLILSFATRMALDLGLDEAFEQLTHRLTMKDVEGVPVPGIAGAAEEENVLMRKSRTWFGLLVLEHIFSLDGGKPPGIRMTGNARRCRKLLRQPSSTVLDLRLFSQVELNVIRVHINEILGGKSPLARADIAAFVQDAKLDLDLWFDDWQRIIGTADDRTELGPMLIGQKPLSPPMTKNEHRCWPPCVSRTAGGNVAHRAKDPVDGKGQRPETPQPHHHRTGLLPREAQIRDGLCLGKMRVLLPASAQIIASPSRGEGRAPRTANPRKPTAR
ncbi:putative C6 transcription factor [Aspergillus mulundensis]|uniref:Putative Zn(II)2Cys6 transcription factor n=1 Tax=Aspergillus mulundensis TaxID=1810919 RepID=A0A3D8Q7T1_9EURO|nr:putative Zn(II)2Cys6 transcription factor [Aspergillus mulundensis]RDW57883.1 putative Zn(II)2Cys6 transcription factor [Aspergillus mulundensis]